MAMFSDLYGQLGAQRLRRILGWAVLGFVLAAAGCTTPNLRGDPFVEDEWSTLPRAMRPAGDDEPPSAWSNKARQIDRNLGGSR